MGGGNGNKTMLARLKHMKEGSGPSAKSTLNDMTAKQHTICKICRQTYGITASPAEFTQHWETKHQKKGGPTIEECFDYFK